MSDPNDYPLDVEVELEENPDKAEAESYDPHGEWNHGFGEAPCPDCPDPADDLGPDPREQAVSEPPAEVAAPAPKPAQRETRTFRQIRRANR